MVAANGRRGGRKLAEEGLKRPQVKQSDLIQVRHLQLSHLWLDCRNHASGENAGLLFTNARRHGNVLKILIARIRNRHNSCA
jgi:hypothetical protein